MRGLSVTLALLVIVVAAGVAMIKWESGEGGLPDRASAATSGHSGAAPAPDRPKINALHTAAPQPATPPVSAAPAAATPATDQQLDQRLGTAEPGDPQTQPEEVSEQFMHSRRGDGQHSE